MKTRDQLISELEGIEEGLLDEYSDLETDIDRVQELQRLLRSGEPIEKFKLQLSSWLNVEE